MTTTMLYLLPILLLGWPLLALADDEPAPPGRWTLENFQRTCDAADDACAYSFSVLEGEEGSGAGGSRCSFSVSSRDTRPAWKTPWTGVRCAETEAYVVNGAYNDEGRFVVVSVVKEAEDVVAYFGFQSSEIGNGTASASKSSEVHKLPGPGMEAVLTGLARGRVRRGAGDVEEAPALEYANSWSIFTPVRSFEKIRGTWEMNMAFLIETPGVPGVICNILQRYPPGVKASEASWFNHKCSNVDWFVSWAYNEETGGGAMTLTNPNRDKSATFEWEQVNDRVLLGNNGPGRTQESTISFS